MRLKRAVLGAVALAAVLSFPALATPGPSYTISLTSVSEGVAEFEITRSTPSGDIHWVVSDCSDLDAVVVWGTDTSLIGAAALPVAGETCTAILTKTPWKTKHNDPSVTFEP